MIRLMATWTIHLDGGPKRVNHAAVCIDGFIYSFGGFCTGDDFSIRQDIDVHQFDINNYKWTKVVYNGKPEDIPYQRYGHTSVAYNGCCYIYGGRNDVNGVSEHLYQFDVVTKTWTRPKVSGNIPFSRDGHTCCVVGNSMYLFAGFEQQSMEFSRSVYALNLDTFVWTSCRVTSDDPLWRDFHTATAWKHYMIIFGGRSDEYGPLHTNREIYSNDIYMFDTREHSWIKPVVSGDIPVGRRSHNAFLYNDKVFIFGGYNSKLGLHFNDLCMYDPVTKVWTKCVPNGVKPRVRRRSCCCLIDNLVIIFGGTSPEICKGREILNDLSDLYILDMAPSLQTLCITKIIEYNLSISDLPTDLMTELQCLKRGAVQSRVPNG